LGWAFVAGRNLVPSPAAGMTAFLTFMRPPLREPEHTVSGRRVNVLRLGEREPRLHFDHADVRVRLHELRATRRDLPAVG
jgi:hypothetical protein